MASAPSKTQHIKRLIADKNLSELEKIIDAKGAGHDLTHPALLALADGIIDPPQFDLINRAFANGWEELTSRWTGWNSDGVSAKIDLAKARKSLSKRSGELLHAIEQDIAKRIQNGEFDLWERHKGDPKLFQILCGKTKFSSAEETPNGRLLSSLAHKFPGLNGVPEDLKALALLLARKSRLWDPKFWEPEITYNGGFFSRNQTHLGGMHELIMNASTESCLLMLQLLPTPEYGTSGFDPLDSALLRSNGTAPDSHALADAIVRQDPLELVRPRKSAFAFELPTGTETHERPVRIPLVDFINYAEHSADRGFHAFHLRGGSTSPLYEDFARRAGFWLHQCHLACASPDAENWRMRSNALADAARDGKIQPDQIFETLRQEAQNFASRHDLRPRIMPSHLAHQQSPGYAERQYREQMAALAKASAKTAPAKSTPATPEAGHGGKSPTVTAEPARETPKKSLPKASETISAITKHILHYPQATAELARAICQGDWRRAISALNKGADPNGLIGKADTMLSRAQTLDDASAAQRISDALIAAGARPAPKPPGK